MALRTVAGTVPEVAGVDTAPEDADFGTVLEVEDVGIAPDTAVAAPAAADTPAGPADLVA